MNSQEIEAALSYLDQWSIEPKQQSIYKEWGLKDFKSVVKFLNQVCELADQQDHHPEILTTYTNIRIRLWTHDASGLTEKDFAMAAAIDNLLLSKSK